MRINWMIAHGNMPQMHDIFASCQHFFATHKVVPDTIKMSYHDMTNFLSMMPIRVETLERGKQYSQFIAIPGGMVELQVLESDEESTAGLGVASMIIVESTMIDREFERHILNKDQT